MKKSAFADAFLSPYFGGFVSKIITLPIKQATPAIIKGAIQTIGPEEAVVESLKWPASCGPAIPAIP